MGMLRRMVVRILLFPIIPCLQWGPFTHPHVNRLVLEKCDKTKSELGCPEVFDAVFAHKETYIYGGNSPDAISTNHVLRNRITYDYAHNNIPDKPDGAPIFGYRLICEALKRVRSSVDSESRVKHQKDLAFACGWLSHQLADWVPHYESVESPISVDCGKPQQFAGYANSHQVLTPAFYEDILRVKEVVEHGIVELFHDIHVMETDKSDYFKLGRNRVWLPEELKENLITMVSESFRLEGHSRIPARHLPSLVRDFNIVIKGMETLIILLKRLQPCLTEVVAEFVAARRTYVKQSVDLVFNGLFVLSTDELLERARASAATPVEPGRVRIVPERKESLLQKLAFMIGDMLPQDVVAALSAPGPLVSIKYDIGRRWLPVKGTVDVDIIERLRRPLIGLLDSIAGKNEDMRALVRFVSSLISTEDGDPLEAARRAYCEGLRPIVSLDYDPSDSSNEEEALCKMLGTGTIDIRFTPALRLDKNTPRYRLDRNSVVIQINGYGHKDPHAPFSVAVTDESSDILRYHVNLAPEIPPGLIHIFADISDGRGSTVHAQYLDRQVQYGK